MLVLDVTYTAVQNNGLRPLLLLDSLAMHRGGAPIAAAKLTISLQNKIILSELNFAIQYVNFDLQVACGHY